MSNVSEFSTTAASNNSAPPNGAPEGMSPASLNDVIRENMAALAKWYKDQQGTITTGGTTTAYTLTTNNAHAALDDIGLFAFQVNATNTGAATLNVDSLGAKSMNLNGAALGAGDIVADEIVLAVYNPDNDVFDLFKSGLSQSTILANTINELTSGNGVTIDSVSLKDGGITVGATIVSDTDSTDDLGTTSARWANVYTDSIGDTGQDLTVAATTVNFPSGGVFDFNGGDITLTHSANTLTFNGGTLALGANALTGSGTVTLSGGGSLTGTWSDLGTVTTVDINGGTVDGSVIGGATAAAGTFTNLTASTDLTLASGATVTAILDQDDMSSDSATALATQQSIRAYVDATVVAIGALSVSGSPSAGDFAVFTGAATIEGQTPSSATVATGDKVLIQDVDDSDNLKTVTAQSIADLAASDITRDTRTSNTILDGDDKGKLIDFTSGTFTQTFDTVAAGWFVYLKNSGDGDVTLDITLDGVSSPVMYPGESRLVQFDGTNFTSVVLAPFAKRFTSSGTFTKPPGYSFFKVQAIGGGGGGGVSASSTNGSGGGGGGSRAEIVLGKSVVGTTETVTVGAGGSGASGEGDVGGNSTFGSHLTGYGGGGGDDSREGGSGGGNFSAGVKGSAGGGLGGGIASAGSDGAMAGNATQINGGGGAAAANYGVGGNAYYGGGGGGGGSDNNNNAGAAGSSLFAAGGGGGGAGNNAARIGGAGGDSGSFSAGGGGAGGNSSDGADGASSDWGFGQGGGGGAGGGSGYNGGDGGTPGGGGGGGGRGSGSGLGGDGGDGQVRVWGVA